MEVPRRRGAARKSRRLVLIIGVLIVGLSAATPAEARRTVYVAGASATIAFELQGDAGLNAVPGPVWYTEGGLSLAPDASVIFATDPSGDQILRGGVGAGGSVSLGAPYPLSGSPVGSAVHPSGDYLYVALADEDRVAALRIGAAGALEPVGPYRAVDYPRGVAATPDGRYLYVTSHDAQAIHGFEIAGDGSLSPVPGSPFATSGWPGSIVVTTDGDQVLAAGQFSTGSYAPSLHVFDVRADGSLSMAQQPVEISGSSIALDPRGGRLYANGEQHLDGKEVGLITAYDLSDDGSVAPETTVLLRQPTYAVAWRTPALAVSPDGRHVLGSLFSFDHNGDHVISGAVAVNVREDGTLEEASGSPYDNGGEWPRFQSVAVSPDQPPIAAFESSTLRRSGGTVSFDASSSSDPDGEVARYDWDFGDGITLKDGGPRPTHTYADRLDPQVTLNVTDDEGCSTEFVFTGQTASCNGSGVARVTHSVLAPEVRRLRVRPRAFVADGEATRIARSQAATIKLTLTEAATVRFRVRGKHVFIRDLPQGRNEVPFTGTFGEHTPSPGSYELIARARDPDGHPSERKRTRFRILD